MKRVASAFGLLIFFLGCGLVAFLAWNVINAKVDVLFASLASGALPLEGELQCPLFIARGGTADVVAPIENRINDNHYYSVHIYAPDFEISGSEQSFGLRLSPHETREVEWNVMTPDTGCFVIFVGAISDSDNSICGNLPCLWTTSYRLGCGTCVIDILGLPPQLVYLLSLGSTFVGAIILVPELIKKWRYRNQWSGNDAIEG